VTSRNRP